MLGAVEASHAAIGLVPHAKILELRKDLGPRIEELAHMAPVHADKGDSAIPAGSSSVPQGLAKEGSKGLRRHLASAHRKLAMASAAQAADMAIDRHVVGRVGEDQVGPFVTHKEDNHLGFA